MTKIKSSFLKIKNEINSLKKKDFFQKYHLTGENDSDT